MSERDKGLYRFLFLPFVYRLFNWILGADSSRAEFTRKYIQPADGDNVLDIGCGTGEIIEHLQGVVYSGYDINKEYIDSAIARFGNRGRFYCMGLDSVSAEADKYNITLAIGLLHHLDDLECKNLFELAKTSLKNGGKLVTIDGVYTDDQSFLAKFMVSRDRGKHIRTVSEYKQLVESVFTQVEIHVENHLIRIPYTHIILICKK